MLVPLDASLVPDGVRCGFDGPIRGRQKRIESERDSGSQTKNDADISAAPYLPRDRCPDSPKITFSPNKLSPESITVSSANLKLVFEVEYRAPD